MTEAESAHRLLERAQAGDIEAFAELFEQQRRFVYAIACRLTGVNDGEDVVMETFLKAWKALPGFHRQSSLKTWLAKIARNCALDFCRRADRRTAREVTVTDDQGDNALEQLADPAADGANPASQAVDRETQSLIQQAMAQLSEEQRVAVVMREVDGLSYREIAAATGVGVGTVMSRLFYGKRKLRGILQEMYDEQQT